MRSTLWLVATIVVLQGVLTIVLHAMWGAQQPVAEPVADPPRQEPVEQEPAPINLAPKLEPKAAPKPAPKPASKPGKGLKDVWEPPAKPSVGRPPARPKLPVVGSGEALSGDDPARQRLDDPETATRPRASTRRNRGAASRLVGHDELWSNETIFVSIASYRDPECAKTVSRAFDRAAVPNRVRFGIFQQNAAEDVDCAKGLADLVECPEHAACGRLEQIRVHRVHWEQTLGPTVARHLSETLYNDETYVMSFDSHTNFASGWDVIAIDMFKRIGDARAIITTYPASYEATNHSERWMDVDTKGPCRECRRVDDQRPRDVNPTPATQMSICRTRRVQVGRTLSFKHDVNRMKRPSSPTRVAFLAAGFNFARGTRVREVPYDPHSFFLFDGEETSLAIRAWTHGYTFYQPDRDVVSHLYIPNHSPLRPVFWTTDWTKRARIQFWTMLRINYILGLHDLLDYWVNASLIDTRDLDKYGLGTRRRVQDYWTYAEVDPRRHGPEWSPQRCKLFESTGLDAFPSDPDGAHNDYRDYSRSFHFEEDFAEARV